MIRGFFEGTAGAGAPLILLAFFFVIWECVFGAFCGMYHHALVPDFAVPYIGRDCSCGIEGCK
jgi:hypothetical protein